MAARHKYLILLPKACAIYTLKTNGKCNGKWTLYSRVCSWMAVPRSTVYPAGGNAARYWLALWYPNRIYCYSTSRPTIWTFPRLNGWKSFCLVIVALYCLFRMTALSCKNLPPALSNWIAVNSPVGWERISNTKNANKRHSKPKRNKPHYSTSV